MDAGQIRELGPSLQRFLTLFDDCFSRRDTRSHLPVYVSGQLSDLPRKSVEPIAMAADRPVRTLQEFLTHSDWDHDRMRQRVAEIVVSEHADPESIGLIDETGWVKKGTETPGVQRQYCGAVGKQENCIMTVHLGYAAHDFHCLLDGDLYLPESWDADRARCKAAGIPDDVVYRSKSDIALDLYDRARQHGVTFEWLTFDEWYGGKPAFLRALDERGQNYVAEVPKNVMAWIGPPRVVTRPYRHKGRGRSRKTPRMVSTARPAQSLEYLSQNHRALSAQPWQAYYIKDTQKGPLVWYVKHVLVSVKDENGLPSNPRHLLRCEHPLTGEVKYFVSNAPVDAPVTKLLHVAFSRWRVERCFEDQKGRIGLDHWEGRRWIGLQRHLTLSLVSYLFLARTNSELGKKNTGPDCVPIADRHRCGHTIPCHDADRGTKALRADRRSSTLSPAAECLRTRSTHQTHIPPPGAAWPHTLKTPPL